MGLTIVSEKDTEKLVQQVSKHYNNVLTELSEQNTFVVSGWPGGRSLLKFFPAFSNVLKGLKKELLKKQHFFQVDERIYQDFNREILESNFFSILRKANLIESSQVHYYPTEQAPEDGLNSYSEMLDLYGSKYHYIMLGAGGPHQRDEKGQITNYDCHVAGIFANHPSSKPNIAKFNYYFDSPKPPPGRITATYDLLSKSEYCFLFIMGTEKKEVLSEFLNPTTAIENSPIHIAKKIKNCILITDQEI